MNRAKQAAASVLLSVGFFACSLAVSADREQCTTNADCHRFATNAVCVARVCQAAAAAAPDEAGAAEAGPTDPAWSCLGQVPTLLENPAEHVSIQFMLYDYSGKKLVNLKTKLCRSQDIVCQNPVGEFASAEDGTTLPIYTGFRGYLESVPSADYPDLIPFRTYVPIVNPKIPASGERQSLTVFSTRELSLVSSLLRTQPNPALGHVIFIARDCQNALATDVTASTESATDESTTFYLDSNQVPSRDQVKTSVPGVGGIFNLTPGVIALKYERNGQYVGSQNVVIREGSVTYVNAIPTP